MNDIKIYLVKISGKIEESIFRYLLGFIREDKKERILMQGTKQNADNMLIGEILTKVAIKMNFDIDIKEQKIACSKYGKPYLTDYPNAHFNISHSGNYVACAVSDKPVGTDIQKIGKYCSDTAKRVCSEEELKQISDSSDKASEFTRLWTQNEAVLIMCGTGFISDNVKNCLDNKSVQSRRVGDYWLSISC